MKRGIKVLAVGAVLVVLSISLAQAAGMADMSGMSGMSGGKVEHDRYGVPGEPRMVTRTVRITAFDTMRFSPSSVHVHPGQTVRFIIHNAGHLTHEFVVGDRREQREHEAEMAAHPDMKMDHDPNGLTLTPGATRTLIWRFPRHVATLEYACHEPGHFAAGMVGYIHVRGAAQGITR
ncbi:MAG: cupredoxin domain-containing protein [Acidiferrobacterales bacterium]